MIQVYVTYPKLSEARKISELILKKRLSACVNFYPVESLYWWQGKLVKDKEVVSIIKTQKKHYRAIEQLIKKHHSYQVPCILELPVNRVYKKYLNWIKEETN